jgi:hypothetical protein
VIIITDRFVIEINEDIISVDPAQIDCFVTFTVIPSLIIDSDIVALTRRFMDNTSRFCCEKY